MTKMINRVKDLSKEMAHSLIDIRRHLHQHPELSFQEFNTAKYISSVLNQWGIEHKTIADTGVFATIKGSGESKEVLVLRGDIDALPIQEESGLDFSSKNAGVMHACGHDIHTTCVLGAGHILNQLKDSFSGTIHLLFQPGEELLPGGALKVIESGVLDQPTPKAIVGQHVYPDLVAGKVGIKAGIYMASADELYFSILGSGGHAALPSQTDNILYLASKAVQQIQERVEEMTPDHIPTVIRFGKMEAMGATNVIPKEVKVAGTFRTMNETWRISVHQIIEQVLSEVVSNTKATFDLNVVKGYPVLFNNEKIARSIRGFAAAYVGEKNVIDLEVRMTSEDFAHYSQKYDSCFYRLGTGFENEAISKLHSPNFMANEKALELGAGLMAYNAMGLMS